MNGVKDKREGIWLILKHGGDMKRHQAVPVIIAMTLVLLIAFLLHSGCAADEKERQEPALTSIEMMEEEQEEQADNPDYEVKNVEMSKEEQDRITEKLSSVMKKCSDVYSQIDIEEALNTVLKENEIHGIIDCAAEDGSSVICGSRDDNMRNYERVDKSLRKAKQGEKAETDFYTVNKSGVFRYYRLQFEGGSLSVTFASAVYNKSMEPVFQQMEKILAYRWEYTEKGWLIWEKALSRNQEMDMHIFYRILPLSSKCREIAARCITPVSYFGNNLFLTDWNQDNMEGIEFNDLYDSLYYMAAGKKIEKENYTEGIPCEEFEGIVSRYFDMTTEQIRQYGAYNEEKGVYPWIAINAWNRLPQLQPFPEVVECTENDDGTLSVRVEAVFVEEGTDCSFRHIVTLREDENGNYKYLGNKVDWENVYRIPTYKARREF